MDFVVGLPRTQSGYDSLWLIVDRLTKVAHFMPIKTTYTRPQLVELYIYRIVYLLECPSRLCPKEEPNLFQSSGKDCTKPWIPV
jgi:hypothetical protein